MADLQSSYEPVLRQQIQDLLLSTSHGFEHIDRVLMFACMLQTTYGGDIDIITAATLLHDLGRSDTQLHGLDSIQKSITQAQAILTSIGFPAAKIDVALKAISEHDQPDIQPSSLEGRILKDADFLAGFGAIGIIRSALWTGESGGDMQDFIARLQKKMPMRMLSLTFEQSRRIATKEFLFVQLFIDMLNEAPRLPTALTPPYITIEGISGSGKSTQVDLLQRYYADKGTSPCLLHEPTSWYQQSRALVGTQYLDDMTRLLLLLLDRHLFVQPRIEEAWSQGNPVITSRSYLSTMVYQADSAWLSPTRIAYMHAFLPQPTHIVVLDLEPEIALVRIESRLNAGGTRGEYEQLERLRLHRQRFLDLKHIFPYIQIIDAQRHTPDEIHEKIIGALMS
jgi:dTMP kinase